MADRFFACGIATVHSAGEDWTCESTFTVLAEDVVDIPYVVKSGETFNVMQSVSTPDVYAFQPQTATNVLIPLSVEYLEQYKGIWAATSLNPKGPQVGIDVLVWYPEDNRPLVDVE